MILKHQVKENFNKINLDKILQYLHKGKYFNAHYSELNRDFMTRGRENKAFEIFGFLSYSRVPYPDWRMPIDYLLNLQKDEKGNSIKKILELIGKSLIEEGLMSKKSWRSGGYIPLEFQLGRHILKDLGQSYPLSYDEIDLRKDYEYFDDEKYMEEYAELQKNC